MLFSVEKSADGSFSLTDHMGFPCSYEEVKEIAKACVAILNAETPESLARKHDEFFKENYPSMYFQCNPHSQEAQEYWNAEYKKQREERRKESIRKAEEGGGRLTLKGNRLNIPGFIYVAFNADTGLYKIGLSKNVGARIKQIANDQACDVTLFHSFPVMRMGESEAMMHERFRDKHVYGEWFRLDSTDIETIQSIKSLGGAA